MSCSRHPQSVSTYQSTEKKSRCGANGQKMYAKKYKWVKQVENPKMPDPQCIKTYYQTTMMPKVPQSMGFYCGQMPKWLHYACTALKVPPRKGMSSSFL